MQNIKKDCYITQKNHKTYIETMRYVHSEYLLIVNMKRQGES